ncbi:MAG: hypothetical protein ACE5EB_02590 [Thermodesulfobacteriota bacterium]
MDNIKHHHIRFKKGPAGSPGDWEAELKKVTGVRAVSIDAEKGDVYVEYDLNRCCEEAVEKWMVNKGFVLDNGFLEKVKRGWVHYTEENEQDAMKAEPTPCCEVKDVGDKKEVEEK